VQSFQVQVPRETIKAATPNPESVPRAYVIQSGDTLSKISKRFYGTPNRYQDIFQANRDRIKTPNALKVGQEIRIP
jgi:nucleoid-associated protein YgaU